MLIQLDLTKTSTIDQLFDIFDDKFGIPEWFGRNYNTMADCLFTFYFPEESLCGISNENETYTVLECTQHQQLKAYRCCLTLRRF